MNRIITLTTLLFLTFQVFGQDYKYVNTETLNIRENAGKQYNVIGQVHEGDKVTALSESNSWTQIETESGVKGYVATIYLSTTIEEQKSNYKKDSSWVSVLIALGILGYVGYKVKNFFSGLFGGTSNSSSSSRSQPRSENSRHSSTPTYKLKVNPLRWYHCKNCNIKIEAGKQPTSLNCSADTFHRWTDLGSVGNQAYSCKNCGTTVYTEKQPTSLNCSRDTFHRWTKLS